MTVALKYPLVLASASPRRQQLLREWDYDFEVLPAPIAEPHRHDHCPVSAAAWAESLAWFKAAAVAPLRPDALILAADTVVEFKHHIVGKPRDLEHAREILTHHFGGRNDVITGLALLLPAKNRRLIAHETTSLDIRPMTNEEREAYLASGAWKDKAGAYALQEGGDKFVQAMHGCETNVVGLPKNTLTQLLERIQQDEP